MKNLFSMVAAGFALAGLMLVCSLLPRGQVANASEAVCPCTDCQAGCNCCSGGNCNCEDCQCDGNCGAASCAIAGKKTKGAGCLE